MKKSIFAALVWAASMAPMSITAQNVDHVNHEAVARAVAKARTITWQDGTPVKYDGIVAEASHRTFIFDYDGKFETTTPAYRQKGDSLGVDSLVTTMATTSRRNVLSGVYGGADLGYMYLGYAHTPVIGAHLGVEWRKIGLCVGFLGGISEFNDESNNPGKKYFCPMIYGELDYHKRCPNKKYNNQVLWGLGLGVIQVFNKNSNDVATKTYIEENKLVTESSEFKVEGNSTSFYLFFKMRWALKHMGNKSMGFKVFAGITSQYYEYGNEFKPIAGGMLTYDLSGAKKRTDADVKYVSDAIMNGNASVINDYVNEVRKYEKH